MKRLQIYIDPSMDEALALEAAREHDSKAAIIRRLIAEHIGERDDFDSLDELIGTFDGDPGDVDDVVYSR